MNPEERARLLDPEFRKEFSRRRFEEVLLQYRRASYAAGVRIVCKSYPCDFARSIAGAYRLDSVPVFPPEECNQVDGACTCSWEIIFVDDEEPDEWKVARSVHPLARELLDRSRQRAFPPKA